LPGRAGAVEADMADSNRTPKSDQTLLADRIDGRISVAVDPWNA
jgi:hypothetical protein